VPIVLKSGSLNPLELSGPVKACNVIDLPLPLPYKDCSMTSRVTARQFQVTNENGGGDSGNLFIPELTKVITNSYIGTKCLE
jgi:hypothetical protein